MISTPKLCFAIAFVSMFAIVETNDADLLKYLSDVRKKELELEEQLRRHEIHGSKVVPETKRVVSSRQDILRSKPLKDRLCELCLEHLRDLLLLQLLEVNTAMDQEHVDEYGGCVHVMKRIGKSVGYETGLPNIFAVQAPVAGSSRGPAVYEFFGGLDFEALLAMLEDTLSRIPAMNFQTKQKLAMMYQEGMKSQQWIRQPAVVGYCTRIFGKVAMFQASCGYILEAQTIIVQ